MRHFKVDSTSFIVLLVAVMLLAISGEAHAQEDPELLDDNWDNILYFGNKVGWGSSDEWRSTAEFQTRYRDDFSELEQWHLEYVGTYLVGERLEVVPDFRFTRKPDRLEYRPGLGVVFKSIVGKSQIVQQVKWQWDIKNGRSNSQGVRYGIFYNYVFTENWVGSFVGGGMYEYGDAFKGFVGLRVGPAIAYVIDKQHSLNVGYFYGLINTKQEPTSYTHVGIPSIQLIINIRKEYKYVPAKYFMF